MNQKRVHYLLTLLGIDEKTIIQDFYTSAEHTLFEANAGIRTQFLCYLVSKSSYSMKEAEVMVKELQKILEQADDSIPNERWRELALEEWFRRWKDRS